ncbi:MAG: alpha/beta hydrolase-fold protein [Bacteroidia bacterium]|nr:alpha/beta hydrolase-fold protein [Bacteroidia bacterium]
MNSTILDEERKLWIYVPEGNDQSVFTKERYPVVYLLDGDGHFFSVAGMLRQLSTTNGNTVLPKMIVVGIPNTNRTRDLTPTKPEPGDDPFMNPAMLAHAGGGGKFLSFLEQELIPYIDENYPTEPYKILIGHSFGGLAVMNILQNSPELFNAYVSIDPSMSWHKQKLLQEIKQNDFGDAYRNRSLFMGFANTMTDGMDTATVKDDKSPMTYHIRSILELNSYLNANKRQLDYKGVYYADDDHGSVPLITEYEAFRYIFKGHGLTLKPQDVMDPNSDLAGKFKNHYSKLSDKFGYEKKPGEAYLNMMGYQLMSMKMYDKSEALFKLNIHYYPNSFNVYDSLGDLYVAKGEKGKAIENFKKALSINSESKASQEKLEKLESE